MAFTSRQIIVFVAGLAVGGAAAWAVFGGHGGSAEPAAKKSPAASAKAAGAAPVSVAVGACDFKPVVATAASDDGRVQLQASLSGRGPKDIEGWLLEGKEAVAAGRQRDAESDFLMACRAAEELGDAGVLPQAEAMYHLGRHYAGLAGAAPASGSPELWRRAEGLFSASLKAFDARYGQESDKTRFAAKGLAEVQAHATGGAPAVAAAPAPAKDKVAENKVAKAAPPAPAKVEPPKEPIAKAEPRKEAVARAEPPKPAPAPEPKAAPPSKPEPEPRPVVAEKPKAPEPQVAVAKPAAPKPRPAPAQASDETIVEPTAAASGSATGSAEPAPSQQ